MGCSACSRATSWIEPGLVVGDDEGLPGGADVDIEVIFGDIETDEELVHDPSL